MDLQGMELQRDEEICEMRNFTIYNFRQILLERLIKDIISRTCSTHKACDK
jgi:hypothetical protein